MSQIRYDVKVPGKLFIAGEYAVVDPGQQAVVIAVDRYVTAQIKQDQQNLLSLPDLGIEQVTWNRDGHHISFSDSDPRLRFIRNAIMLVNQLLEEKSMKPRPLCLTVTSELDDPSGKKYGLGSSAAITVAVISALLHFYQCEKIQPTNEIIFKLAAIVHLKTQGNGSCADIAASTYGGWIRYTTFSAKWLFKQLKQGKKLSELCEVPWHKLKIAHLTKPPMLALCVGWTGDVVGTAGMVDKIQTWRESHENAYTIFLQASADAVANVIDSFERGNGLHAISSLTKNRKLLKKLGDEANVPIETAKLKQLITIAEKYGGAKSSGAGGGDCGIAFVEGKEQAEKLRQEWEKAGILPLDLHVSQDGALATAY